MDRKIAWLVMFLLPIPVFLSPSSKILLANGTVFNDALAFPLSFFLTPVITLVALKNVKRIKGVPAILILLLAAFAIWVAALAFTSAIAHPISLVYAFQWVLMLFWGGYFLSSLDEYSLTTLVRPFFMGAFAGATYIFLSGALEIAFHGALQDFGRMTQNLILKGQYQLYVYTPTLLAICSLIVMAIYKSGNFPFSKIWFYIYLVVSLLAVLFTGAREGLLIWGLGGFLIFFVRSMLSMFVALVPILLVSVLIYFNIDSLMHYFASSDLRMFNKIARLADDGAALGSRDLMMASYLGLIERDYFLALMLLPPELAYPDAGVSIKSAHNFYVDVWAWTGFPGFLFLLLFTLSLLFVSVINILKNGVVTRPNKMLVNFSWIILLVLLVSNNINVPLRQPLIVPIFMFCVFAMFYADKYMNPSKVSLAA